jgi:uncharacterized membrane protein HdeD (DUF308 family)
MNASFASEAQPGRFHSIWFVMLGVIMVLCGAFALLAPLASALAFTLIFGISTLIAGIAEIIHAFGTKTWRGFFLNLLLGIAYAVLGGYIIMNPLVGVLALSLTIGAFLVGIGLGEIVMGLRVRGERGWVWLILTGLVTLGFGIWLLLRMPVAGVFMAGTFLGIALILQGISFIGMAGGARRARAAAAAEPAA